VVTPCCRERHGRTDRDAKLTSMRRLFPSFAESVPTFAASAEPQRRRHRDGRPWVEICMVASIDGATTVDGTSGGLSSATDHELLLSLRLMADVVVVGAATARAEGYGPPRKAGLRVGVVTSSGRGLDWDSALFTSGAGFLITTIDAPEVPVDTVRAGYGTVDLRSALDQLGVGFVHGEGGGRLNGSLLEADLVDEVNLTISPHLAGGDSGRITVEASSALRRFQLAQVLEEDGFVFCRYVRPEH
jgi:riboflavin biosynthesis pyrimidine reductase